MLVFVCVCDNVRECCIFDFAFNGIRFEIVMRVSVIATRFRWKYGFYGAKTATTATNKYILKIIFKSNSTILFSNLSTWVRRWRLPRQHTSTNDRTSFRWWNVCASAVASPHWISAAAQTWKYCSDWEVIIIYYYYCQSEKGRQPADTRSTSLLLGDTHVKPFAKCHRHIRCSCQTKRNLIDSDCA